MTRIKHIFYKYKSELENLKFRKLENLKLNTKSNNF